MTHSSPKKCRHCKKELRKDQERVNDPLNGRWYIHSFDKGFCNQFCYDQSDEWAKEKKRMQEGEAKVARDIAGCYHPKPSDELSAEDIVDLLDLVAQHEPTEEEIKEDLRRKKKIRMEFYVLVVVSLCLIFWMVQSC